jgi:hypothetical protein
VSYSRRAETLDPRLRGDDDNPRLDPRLRGDDDNPRLDPRLCGDDDNPVAASGKFSTLAWWAMAPAGSPPAS